jgi:hypothetical protein
MKIIRCFAFGFLLLAFSLAARPADSTPQQPRTPAAGRNITIDDYFQIRDVSQPELSPDGQWVA